MKTTEPFRVKMPDCDDAAEILDDLLDRWEVARQRGDEISLEEICRDSPEFLPPLRDQVNRLLAIDGQLDLDSDRDMHHAAGLDETGLQINYDDLKLHATGGLGAVYSARDQRLHRHVALKFLRRKLLCDELSQDQFQLEAEITSRLEHPGVVPVYGFGETDDGRAFYSMRFIQGRTLDDAIGVFHANEGHDVFDPRDREFRELLTHFVALCKTIAYAHNRGIIHCDIKPANVMLGRYGETLVVDWGLAMSIGRSDDFKDQREVTLMPSRPSKLQSSTGMVGTPAYMSPEQFANNAALQPATDLYSLGATFYKLLTGRIPVDAPTLSEVQQRVMQASYARPSQLHRRVPKPLEAICLKAMAVDTRDRYTTALQLAEDIERYMADDAVEAYREPVGRRVARWARRHRHAVEVASIAAVALMGIVLWFSANATHNAKQMESEAIRARNAERAAKEALDDALGSEARALAVVLRSEIGRRLDAVESAAADPELAAAVAALAASDPHPVFALPDAQQRFQALLAGNETRDAFLTLQTELERSRRVWQSQRGFERAPWFVILNNGMQAGRAPMHVDESGDRVYDSLGDYFGYRQYFHGGSPNPPSSYYRSQSPPPPISQTYLAAPHESTNSGTALVTFTTPVRDPAGDGQGEIVGILGIAVPVIALTDIDQELARSGPNAATRPMLTIAYLRDDWYGEGKFGQGRGLILQHEAFRQREQAPAPSNDYTALRLSGEIVEATWDRDAESPLPLAHAVLAQYQDPVAQVAPQFDGEWTAAIAPVVSEATAGRDATCADTGWCVVLQRQQTPDAPEPK